MIGTRFINWLLRVALPDTTSRTAIASELAEERDRRLTRLGPPAADRWYWRQVLSVCLWAVRDRLLGHKWHGPHPRYQSRVQWMERSRWNIQHSASALRRSPGYTLAVILTLGVALAATTVTFTTVHGILLSELPYPEAHTLIRIDALEDGIPIRGGISYPTFLDWQGNLTALSALAVYQGSEGVFVSSNGAEVWRGASVSSDFLSVMGIQPLLGTFYDPTEGQPGEQSIYLGQDLWERHFSSDSQIVGRTITFYEQRWQVRGVMPRHFQFPNVDTQYWIPLRNSPTLMTRWAAFLHVIGRTKPNVSTEAAHQELSTINDAINQQHGLAGQVVLRSVVDAETASVQRVLWLFLGAAGLVLLVACANVAALAMARGESRRQEFVLRLSSGATRADLMRMVLTESTLLALAGGLSGVLGAALSIQALLGLAPSDLPRRENIALDEVVLGVAFLATIGVGLVVSILPSVWSTKINSLKPASSLGMSLTSRRTLNGLAASQIAMAVALLTGAGLLLRSFASLTAVDIQFRNPENLLVVEIGLGRDGYSSAEPVLDFHQRLIDNLSALPTVEVVGLSSHLPFTTSSLVVSMVSDGLAPDDATNQRTLMAVEVVSGAYREALGLPLLAGRDLSTKTGEYGVRREVLINQTAAQALWPDQSPLGKRISFGAGSEGPPAEETFHTVVGIVPDVIDESLDAAVQPRAYYEFAQFTPYDFVSGRFFYATIRTTASPMTIVQPIRSLVATLDPNVPLRSVASLEMLIRDTTISAKFRTVVISVFAGLAAIVALLGVYGVTTYNVSSSIRDIGVRMALGANARSVRHEVVRRALVLSALGGAVGLTVVLAAGSTLDSMLFHVTPRDPTTMLAVLAFIVLGAVTASYIPAIRASRTDPVDVLRRE